MYSYFIHLSCFLCVSLFSVFSCCIHVSLFWCWHFSSKLTKYWILIMFCFFRFVLFLYFAISMSHFFCIGLFSCFHVFHSSHAVFFVCHCFYIALTSCCKLFMLHCHVWTFLEHVFCKKRWSGWLFFMCGVKRCKTCNLEILWKHLLSSSSSC